MYSTGKLFPVSVAVEFGRDVVSKYEAPGIWFEFALLTTKLRCVTLNGMTGTALFANTDEPTPQPKDKDVKVMVFDADCRRKKNRCDIRYNVYKRI
jgi:hypothetical protein